MLLFNSQIHDYWSEPSDLTNQNEEEDLTDTFGKVQNLILESYILDHMSLLYRAKYQLILSDNIFD